MVVEGLERLEFPTYHPAFAAKLAGISPGRVRRWLSGYSYRSHVAGVGASGLVHQSPIVHRRAEGGRQGYASFLDVIDLLFIREFIAHGVTLQKIRRALLEAVEIFGPHHFALQQFWTDGKAVFLQAEGRADALYELAAQGQWAFATVIKTIGKKIDFDERSEIAVRWFPLGHANHVVIDPQIAYGAPTIVGKGIETANVYDSYLAENKSLSAVGSWMQLEEREVKAAVKFEQALGNRINVA